MLTFITCVGGCGGDDTADQPTSATPGEAILQCVRSSGAKLDAALAENDVHAVARGIVQLLDDHEDSPEAARFEEFHRAMEELESLAGRETGSEELKGKIDTIKALADRLQSSDAGE